MRWRIAKVVLLIWGVTTGEVSAGPSEYDCGAGEMDKPRGQCKCPATMRPATRNGAAVCEPKPKPPDPDGDGIKRALDRCPTEAEDRDGFQDDDGCPDRDDDGDGVLDGADACPREAEDRDGDADQDGCPEQDAAPIQDIKPTPPITTGQQRIDDEPGPGPEEPAPATRSTPRGRGRQRIGLVAGGVGVAAIAVGSVYGLKARSHWSDVTSGCAEVGSHYECDATGRQADADARSAARISNITFAAGGVALIAGALLYLTAPSGAPSVGVRSTRGGATLTFAGDF